MSRSRTCVTRWRPHCKARPYRLVRIAAEYAGNGGAGSADDGSALVELDQLSPQELFSRAWQDTYGNEVDEQTLKDFAVLLQRRADGERAAMKILAIRLKNLASLAGPFEIDFTAEPLCPAPACSPLPAPRAPARARCSTPCAWRCSARVPRLNNTGRDAKVPDVDGEIATGRSAHAVAPRYRRWLCRSGFSRHRRTPLSGPAGSQSRREKAGGKLQASRQSLRDLDSDQLLASQKGEYKTQLEAALGLNFEQFTRAVLLAQSEFSAFLKADDSDRGELLEKLTDTALYTRLGRRAFDKAKQAKDSHRQLQDQATGVTPLAPEAEAELDQLFQRRPATTQGPTGATQATGAAAHLAARPGPVAG